MTTPLDVACMSHRDDPHTSHDAAERVSKGTKKALLYGAILDILRPYPATPSEVTRAYYLNRSYGSDGWLPAADLQEIRRRMSELQQDGRIEPIKVGTLRTGRPQYAVRDGQRVMRLTEAVS